MVRGPKQDYSDEEAKARFEAALRGARAVGHKPMSGMKVGRTKPKAESAKAKQKKPGK